MHNEKELNKDHWLIFKIAYYRAMKTKHPYLVLIAINKLSFVSDFDKEYTRSLLYDLKDKGLINAEKDDAGVYKWTITKKGCETYNEMFSCFFKKIHKNE